MIRWTPVGGANQIGRSAALLEAYDLRLVVDAGLAPGAPAGEHFPDFDRVLAAGPIDAILVTHAHLDHVGGLPLLYRRTPGVPVYATQPTLRIARLQLLDSVKIMETQGDEAESAFTEADVEAVLRAGLPVAFRTPTLVAESDEAQVVANFLPSGHILGAAMLALEVTHKPTARVERILLSGDVSLFHQPTILGADVEAVRDFQPSLFVCEGTYGADDHPDLRLEEARFVARVAAVVREGGRVLIPAFAVGRAQNVVLLLRRAIERPESVRQVLQDPSFSFPRVPIVLDGMCRQVADVYGGFRDLLHPSLARVPLSDPIFYGPGTPVTAVRRAEDRHALVQQRTPMVVVTSSGMLTGGPSAAFARAMATEPKSAIFLVGYVDEETPGGLLKKVAATRAATGAARIELDGADVTLQCRVETYTLSAHSDAAELERLVAAVRPARTLLVHGTPAKLAALRTRLDAFAAAQDLTTTVEIAHNNEPVTVDVQTAPQVVRAPMRPAHGGTVRVPVGSHPVDDLITGRVRHGDSGFGAGRAVVSAALQQSGRRALEVTDLARLGALVRQARPGPIRAPDFERARETMTAGQGILWQPTIALQGGVAVGVRPLAGTNGEVLRSIVDRAKAADEVKHTAFVRSWRSPDMLEASRARVATLGIDPGDLLLALGGTAEHLWMVPAIALAPTDYGWSTVAPDAPDAGLAYSQILARVGPWPSRSGVPGILTSGERRLLLSLGSALAGVQLEALAVAAEASAQVLLGVWEDARRGALSMPAAMVASLLLGFEDARAGLTLVGTYTELGEALAGAGGQMLAPAVLRNAVQELVQAGLLNAEDVHERLALQLTPKAAPIQVVSAEARAAFATMGPTLESALRAAVLDALRTLPALAVPAEARVRQQAAADHLGAQLESQHRLPASVAPPAPGASPSDPATPTDPSSSSRGRGR